MHEKKSQHATHRRAIVNDTAEKWRKSFLNADSTQWSNHTWAQACSRKEVCDGCTAQMILAPVLVQVGVFFLIFCSFWLFFRCHFFVFFWKVEILKCLEKRRQKKNQGMAENLDGEMTFFSFQLLTYLHLAIAY